MAGTSQVRRKVNPKEDSCCFTCFLPTRLCKGLLGGEGSDCFSPDLLLIFWSVCWLFLRERIKEGQVSFIEGDWVPKQWAPVGFAEVQWHFDTEVIQGAWAFYNFAKGYWEKHRY